MVEPTNHPARDEWERMLSGELYVADSPQQQEANMRKRRLVQAINTSEYDAFKERDELFHELFGAFGEGGFVEPPFNCDYGCNTFIGKNFYATWIAFSLTWHASPSATACSSAPEWACTRRIIRSMRRCVPPALKALVRSPLATMSGSAAMWWSALASPSAMMW